MSRFYSDSSRLFSASMPIWLVQVRASLWIIFTARCVVIISLKLLKCNYLNCQNTVIISLKASVTGMGTLFHVFGLIFFGSSSTQRRPAFGPFISPGLSVSFTTTFYLNVGYFLGNSSIMEEIVFLFEFSRLTPYTNSRLL